MKLFNNLIFLKKQNFNGFYLKLYFLHFFLESLKKFKDNFKMNKSLKRFKDNFEMDKSLDILLNPNQKSEGWEAILIMAKAKKKRKNKICIFLGGKAKGYQLREYS